MIRDRLVFGIQDKGAKARLLREKDLSMDKALDMCKSSEIANKQLKTIQKDEKQNNEELNLVQDKRRQAQDNKKLNQKKPPKNQKKPLIKPGPGKKHGSASIVASIKACKGDRLSSLRAAMPQL